MRGASRVRGCGWPLLACAVLLAGCPAGRPGAPADAGAELAAGAPDSGPAQPPAPVAFSLHAHLPDAGVQELPSGPDVRAVVERPAWLELRSDQTLENYRVRLLDEAESAVPSDDTAEETDAGVVYRVQPTAPLAIGHRYTLSVDAESGAAATDAHGRPVPEQRFEFQVAGEKVRPASRPRPQGERRRRP